jgi:hypothetical protein
LLWFAYVIQRKTRIKMKLDQRPKKSFEKFQESNSKSRKIDIKRTPFPQGPFGRAPASEPELFLAGALPKGLAKWLLNPPRKALSRALRPGGAGKTGSRTAPPAPPRLLPPLPPVGTGRQREADEDVRGARRQGRE